MVFYFSFSVPFRDASSYYVNFDAIPYAVAPDVSTALLLYLKTMNYIKHFCNTSCSIILLTPTDATCCPGVYIHIGSVSVFSWWQHNITFT